MLISYLPTRYEKIHFSEKEISYIEKEFKFELSDLEEVKFALFNNADKFFLQVWIQNIEDAEKFISQNLKMSIESFEVVDMLPYGSEKTERERKIYQELDDHELEYGYVDKSNAVSGLRARINEEDIGFHVIELYKEPNSDTYIATLCKYNRGDYQNVEEIFRCSPNISFWNVEFLFPNGLIIIFILGFFSYKIIKLFKKFRKCKQTK